VPGFGVVREQAGQLRAVAGSGVSLRLIERSSRRARTRVELAQQTEPGKSSRMALEGAAERELRRLLAQAALKRSFSISLARFSTL